MPALVHIKVLTALGQAHAAKSKPQQLCPQGQKPPEGAKPPDKIRGPVIMWPHELTKAEMPGMANWTSPHYFPISYLNESG